MILYGNVDMTLISIIVKDDFSIYNINSFIQGFPNIGLYLDKIPLDYPNRDFILFNQIMNDNRNFKILFDIVMELYYGRDIFLLVSDMDILDDYSETIIKFFQNRYGITPYRINTIEDYYIWKDIDKLSSEFGTMTIQGIYNFDIDRERYLKL